MAKSRRTVHLCGTDYELAASLKAVDIYAEEFAGRLKDPYHGVLEDDMLVTHTRAQRTVKEWVEADKKGEPVKDKSGNYTPVEHGGVEVDVPNPDYRGVDAEALLRYVWAMATATGSVTEGWDEFGTRMEDEDFSLREMASVYFTVILELGGGCIFREPERRTDADEPDEGQRGEGVSADA